MLLMIKAWFSHFRFNLYLPWTVCKSNEQEDYKLKCETLMADVQKLQEIIKQQDSTIEDLRGELGSVVGEQQELQKKHTERLLEISQEEKLRMDLEIEKGRCSALVAELDTLRESIKDKDEEIAEAVAYCQEYHHALEEANQNFESEEKKTGDLEVRMLKLKEEEDYLHLTIDDLEDKMNALRSENEELKKLTVGDLEEKMNALRIENEELKKVLALKDTPSRRPRTRRAGGGGFTE